MNMKMRVFSKIFAHPTKARERFIIAFWMKFYCIPLIAWLAQLLLVMGAESPPPRRLRTTWALKVSSIPLPASSHFVRNKYQMNQHKYFEKVGKQHEHQQQRNDKARRKSSIQKYVWKKPKGSKKTKGNDAFRRFLAWWTRKQNKSHPLILYFFLFQDGDEICSSHFTASKFQRAWLTILSSRSHLALSIPLPSFPWPAQSAYLTGYLLQTEISISWQFLRGNHRLSSNNSYLCLSW